MNKKIFIFGLTAMPILFSFNKSYASFYNYCYFKTKVIKSTKEPVRKSKRGGFYKKFRFKITSVMKIRGRGAKNYCKYYTKKIKTKKLFFNQKQQALNVKPGMMLNIKLTVNPYASQKWEVLLKKNPNLKTRKKK